MRMRKWALSCVVVLGCLVANKARATVSYSYVTDQPSYTGTIGSTVPVDIYLKEWLTNGSTSVITTEGGLTGAGAAVNITGTTDGSPASIASSSFTKSASFAGPYSADYNQGSGNNLEFVEAISAGSEVFTSSGEILLGVLNVTVGTGTSSYDLTSLMNDTINSSSSLLGQEDGNTLCFEPTPLGTDLDATGNAAFTGADAASATVFSVAPAPEPASLSLLFVGGLALLSRRHRRA